jgi:hydroxymethylglutaryl-CoA reductase (NADPH)
MTIPSHVIGMLDRVRARFQAEPLHERMVPSDTGFTSLRPVRKATVSSVAKYWARLTHGWNLAIDKDAIADAATMADPASTAPISRTSSAR